jgi:hypothetical protein
MAYAQIETLQEDVLVAQDKLEATAFRRAKEWQPEVIRQPKQRLRLTSLGARLPLGTVHEGAKVQ